MSYVVKNCPAYDYEEEFDYHICKQPLVPYECSVDDCQKCTDCVIKQIIEKCKNELQVQNNWWCGAKPLAQEILQLLNIQEVE